MSSGSVDISKNSDASSESTRWQTVDIAVLATIAAALALWWTSLPLIDPEQLNDFGLPAILPWQFWAAIGVLSLGFSATLASSSPTAGWLRVAALVVLVLLLHATPPIAYGTLRYSWAWKHIGIVDYIQRYGEVNRAIPFLAAYHNWPGFFWITAKIADFFKLEPVQIADIVRFFPVASNLVFVVLLRSIYRRFTDDLRLVYAALWVFICTNWVGQDYFSPQAFSYALYLMVLSICLGPLMPPASPASTSLGQRISSIRNKLTRPTAPAERPDTWLKILAILVVFFAIFTIAASHQLTPVILVISLVALAALTPLSFGFPVLALFTLVFWIIYPAAPFTAAYLPGEVEQLGQTIDGVTGKLVDTGAVDKGVAVVVWAGRALSAAVALLAMAGWFRRLLAGERDGIPVALLVSPIPILALTSYGGEAIFRIYFFCIPFLAFFAAGLFFPKTGRHAGVMTIVGFWIVIVLMSLGFLFGNNGKDRQYRFSESEVEAAAWLYSRSQPGTLLVEAARSYPSQFMNYENFTYLPIANESPEERAEILDDPSRVLARWFSDPSWNDGYVILTESQKAYVSALGIMPDGALDELALDLLASPDFRLVYANDDVRIFTARRFVD